MADTTNIEKKSLEAHVELCAERYSALESRLDNVDSKISQLEKIICEVRDMVQTMAEKRNDQLINWGLGVIGTLVAAIGYLVTQYVIK
jgi:predicted  nucleic acid-binding Zn-ribbon protein